MGFWGAALALTLASGCASTLDKARTAHDQGAWDDAEVLYVKATKEPEGALLARNGLADLHVARAEAAAPESPKAAEGHYRDALAVIGVHDAALTGLVRLLRDQDRLPDASAVLKEAGASGDCGTCKRLVLVIELERAEQAFAAKNFAAALVHFEAAQAQRDQPAVAVAIADVHLSSGDRERAEQALLAASPGLLKADDSAVQRFVSVRKALLDAALADGNAEAADRIVAIVRPKEPAAEQPARALRVAEKVDSSGDEDAALVRYQALRGASEEALADAPRAKITQRVADIYTHRGTVKLNGGDGAGARAEYEQSLAAVPDDWAVKLQRILAMSSQIGAGPALESLKRVPAKTPGLAHARAILLALEVVEHLDKEDVEAARASLARATQSHSDLPEVHLAAAYVLAVTITDELSSSERRMVLGRRSMVRYPGEVYRHGEALAEVARVRGEVAERKPDYPFTAPWLLSKADALQSRLAATYPYSVAFQPEPEPVLLLTNRGGSFVEITLSGPDGFSDEIGIPPGDVREVVPPEAGLLRLRIGRAKRAYYAESYTKVTLTVP